MRKSNVLVKAIVGAVCLIVALVLSLPVLPMMSSRMFGGGSMDFNKAAYNEYRANRPVKGSVFYVLGTSDGGDSGAVSVGAYYYLVPATGKQINNKNKADTLVLVKATSGSAVYDGINGIYRKSADGNSSDGYKISGVLKKITSSETKTAEELRSKSPYAELQISEYTLDLTKDVKSMTIKFVISLLFYAVAVFCIVITIQAINKNASIEKIEEDRIAYRLEQERKSGNKNDDGSDKMFGDSDGSYGVTPRRDGDDMLGEGSSGGSGGYKPAFQSQGGEQFTPRSDSPFDDSMFGGSSNGSDDEDGFFGGGASQNGGFFGTGAAPGGSFRQGAENQNDFYGGSSSNSDDDGFFGGSSGQGGGFYGASSGSSDDGFFGGSSGNSDDGFFGSSGQGGGFYGN